MEKVMPSMVLWGEKKHGMKHGDYFIGDDEWEMRNVF